MNTPQTPKAQVKDPVRPCAEISSPSLRERSEESRIKDLEVQGIEEEEGWVSLLDKRIKEEDLPFRVINGSVSGETSTGGVERLPGMLSTYRPKVVILELGGNDGLRGLPLELLADNLNKMVDMIHETGSSALLAGIQIPPNYGPRYTVPFTELFYEIAETKQIGFIPFLIDGIPQQPELMQDDGIHPKAEAQALILNNVWPHLLHLIEVK